MMMRYAILVTLVAASLASGEATQNPPATSWRSLFDGKTTKGWRGYRQTALPAGWQVVDGALTRVGAGGDIVSIDQFGDFELMLEWMISPGGNSGVLYRVTEDAAIIWHTAPEMQVIDDDGYKDPLKPAQKSGANYDLHPPSRSVVRAAGAWNEARILVNGAHVEHWLNGVKVVEYELWSPDWIARVKASKFNEFAPYGKARRGHIGFQDHGDRVAFRNIRIRELP